MKRRLLHNKKNQYILITLTVIVMVMSVGYAYLKERLTISGISNIVTGFNIEIVSIEEKEIVNAETINLHRDKTKGTIEVNLNKKGAKAVYDVTVKNSGTLDAIINNIRGIEEANQMEPLDITVKTEGLQSKTSLLKDQTMVFQIIVEWDPNITSSSGASDKTIEFEVEYQQKTEDPSFPPHKYENGEVIYFNPETNTKCSASEYEESNSLNENKSGCMKWYAFNDTEDSSTVKVILDHNTTAKVAWNSSGNNADGMNEVKTALETDINNWNEDVKKTARLIEANEIAKITGNTEFDATNLDENGWFYFENNSQDKPSLSQGQAKYKWLFDYTDSCTNYGCSIADSSATGYWTSTPDASYSLRAWLVSNIGDLNRSGIGVADNFGVRPVITISKSILEEEPPVPSKKYGNGELIYFNPETNTRCSASEYKAENSLNENKSGCMKWYAFNDAEESDTVNVILDHNTTAEVAWNSSGNNSDGMKEVKTALDNDVNNWNEDVKKTARLIEANEIAKITGNTEFDSTVKGKDNYFYFGVETEFETSEYAWLFNNTFGCSTYGCTQEADDAYGYWTSSPSISDTNKAWYTDYCAALDAYYINNEYAYGVRPVITISKSILK